MSERRLALPPARPRGFALILALVMLALMGLASAAVMRNATSDEQMADGARLQAQARASAQLALRFCESQLALAAPERSVLLQPPATPGAWTVRGAWTAGGAAHALRPAEIGRAEPPRVPPQCLMESTAEPDVVTVTARGFSPDYRADPRTGATRHGAAVWLQAMVHAVGASGPSGSSEAAPPAPGVRRRVWQQLLTPPF